MNKIQNRKFTKAIGLIVKDMIKTVTMAGFTALVKILDKWTGLETFLMVLDLSWARW